MRLLYKMRQRFGRFAVRGLTRYIIATYIIGYLITFLSSAMRTDILGMLTLVPSSILQGEIWRIFTWILTPPGSLSFFTVIMLFVYYQLGSVLERVWGDYFYNLFIFFGLICTVIGAFILHFAGFGDYITYFNGVMFSTYYVSLSIFLGFAFTFPEQQMLLFFIIPIKIKYLAAFDVAYLVYSIVRSRSWFTAVQIICSLAPVIILLILHFSAKKQPKAHRTAQQEFKKAMSRGQAENRKKTSIHKCYICGQTEADNPNLEFRYCSKCTGNKEYCSNHLFTHTHS
ncbi:MAG: hypothetical protein IKG70_07690 [Lachnospiraceae bacterium]|nr:hypothetical protein [Lachnospiraceae bacterium]